MENLTHSLVGAGLAELALPAGVSKRQRGIFYVASIVAANLPDADLLYTRIAPPPLGYLLHHRGHTHTVAGAIAQALLIGMVCLIPAIERNVAGVRHRLWALIVVSLLGHLVLDSWNSYGVHPFWPVHMGWYYGDAVYILEPWLWAFLGVAAVRNTQNERGRMVLAVLLVVVTVAITWFRLIPVPALASVAVAAAVLTLATAAWTPRRRSGAAIALSMAFVAGMFALRTRVHGQVVASVEPLPSGKLLDVVLSPQPANPLCWTALTIVRDASAREYVMTRGTVTPLLAAGCGAKQRTTVVWGDPDHQSLTTLRMLVQQNCWVRAWMQFGRAPAIEDSEIGDLRFGGARRGNFSTMPIRPEQQMGCPPHLTRWSMPREDLLTGG